MHRTLSTVACLAVPCFSTLSHKCTLFAKTKKNKKQKKKVFNIIFLSFSKSFVRNIDYSRIIACHIITNEHRSSCKVPDALCQILIKLNFLNRVSQNTQISNLMKLRPWRVELFRGDGRTDGHKEPNSGFSQFL